jgi:hypothetical protein
VLERSPARVDARPPRPHGGTRDTGLAYAGPYGE